MGSHSQAPLQLPTIDFSKVNKQVRGTLIWDSTKSQVFKAFQEYGCFEATFNEISSHLRNSIFTSLKELFDLPLETKLKNTSDKVFNAYVGQMDHVPLFESLGIEDPESFTNVIWPHGNPQFCISLKSYIEKLSELDEIVRMMVLEELNLEKYLEEHMELTDYVVRVMNYSVPKKNESNIGIADHTDKNLMTILHDNEVGGLEVKVGDEWVEAKVSPNCFVVMAGESFHVWTNGRLHPPVHRVVVNGDEARLSIGLFANPKWGKLVQTPKEMVDEEHPLLFKPYDYGEFMKFYNKKENRGNLFLMKIYCGVSS